MPPKSLLVAALLFACWICPASSQAQPQPPNNPAPEATYRYWKTNWSFESIKLGDLFRRLRSIGVEIPVQVDGVATVDFDVAVPLNALRTGKAYQINGAIEVRKLVAGPLQFDLCRAAISLKDGQLTLNRLRCVETVLTTGDAVTESGLLVGSAKAGLMPPGDFGAEVQTEGLHLGPISDLLSRLGLLDRTNPTTGAITSKVAISGRVDELQQPERWNIEGDLDVRGLGVQASQNVQASQGAQASGVVPSGGIGSAQYDLSINGFRSGEGMLQVNRLRVQATDRQEFFTASDIKVRLADSIQFEMAVAANDFRIGDLLRLHSPAASSLVQGKLDTQGQANGVIGAGGTIDSMDVRLAIASPEIAIAGVRLGLLEHDLRLTTDHLSIAPRTTIAPQTAADQGGDSRLVFESLETDYQWNEQLAQFSNLRAVVFGGQASGEGQFARRADLMHRVKLSWSEIAPEINLPILWLSRKPKLSFQTSGEIDWNVSAANLMIPAQHRADVNLLIDRILLDTEPIGQAALTATVAENQFAASLDAQLFGGTVKVKTVSDLNGTMGWQDVFEKMQLGEVNFERLSLRRILKLSGIERPRFDARLSGSVTPNVLSAQASAKISIDGLTADQTLIARNLDAKLEYRDHELAVKSVRGTYAGGQVELDGHWSLGRGEKVLTARLTRAQGDRFLLPIHQQASDWVGGRLSGRAAIVGHGAGIGESFRASGTVNSENGNALGVPIGEAHSPLDVYVSIQPLMWRVSFPSIRSNLARGRVSGDLVIKSASAGRSGLHLDSRWRVNHVDFEALLSNTIGTSTIGRGNLTGDLRLSGRHIREVKDLEGEFRLRLGGTDATAVPGLSAAGSLLGATSLTGVRFENGEASGRISKGRLLLERVAMVSDRVNVQAEGSVGLLNQRMDIDAVISTGQFQGQNVLLRQLGTQAVLDALPIGQVNRVLSDRTIVFKMVGPTRDPVIQLLAGETLRANARRFATQEVIGFAIADSVLFD